MEHALHADIFVQPDAPVYPVAVIYAQLFVKNVEAGCVNFFVVRVDIRVCIYRSLEHILAREGAQSDH